MYKLTRDFQRSRFSENAISIDERTDPRSSVTFPRVIATSAAEWLALSRESLLRLRGSRREGVPKRCTWFKGHVVYVRPSCRVEISAGIGWL